MSENLQLRNASSPITDKLRGSVIASSGQSANARLGISARADGRAMMETLESDGRTDMDFLRKVLYYSDYKTLITLNRSNGGATYFADGFLIRKWAFKALPNDNRLRELGIEDPTEPLLSYGTVGNLSFQAFLLYAFAVMLLL